MNEKEFKHIAPKLFEFKNLKSGFIVPKNYFDLVENEIEALSIQIKFNKEHSFETPAWYFEGVESAVMNRIESENNSIPSNYFSTIENKVFHKLEKETPVVPLMQRKLKLVTSISIAASIVLLFSIQLLTTSNSIDITSLEVAEIENWIADGELDINTYELSSVYKDVAIDEFDMYASYNDDDMLDYLENINVESLMTTN